MEGRFGWLRIGTRGCDPAWTGWFGDAMDLVFQAGLLRRTVEFQNQRRQEIRSLGCDHLRKEPWPRHATRLLPWFVKKTAGFTSCSLEKDSGLAQTQAVTSRPEFRGTDGDDPQDDAFIKLGIKLFDLHKLATRPATSLIYHDSSNQRPVQRLSQLVVVLVGTRVDE